MFDMLFGSYTVAIIKAGIVRFENSKGWYEEVGLTPELAMWILTKKRMEVRYQ